ncbi:hypothetical protein ACHQM5_010316 [Ranunculus cassubicifolius]
MSSFRPSCGACKFLRRKCENECVYAPYFSHDHGANHFSAVHKIFGASNVSKLLLSLPLDERSEAAATITYEALARMHDPVYGCVAHIFALQQQVAKLQEEIEYLEARFVDPAPKYDDHQSSELHLMTVPNSFSQHPSDPFYASNTTTSPVLSNEISPQNSLCEWTDQSLCFESTNEFASLDKDYLGMDQIRLLCDPALDINTYADYISRS